MTGEWHWECLRSTGRWHLVRKRHLGKSPGWYDEIMDLDVACGGRGSSRVFTLVPPERRCGNCLRTDVASRL